MGTCNRCGPIVDDGDSDAAQEVLSFCMKFSLRPKDLVILTDQDIQDAYQTMSVSAQTMISDLADAMRTDLTGSTKSISAKPKSAKPKSAKPKAAKPKSTKAKKPKK